MKIDRHIVHHSCLHNQCIYSMLMNRTSYKVSVHKDQCCLQTDCYSMMCKSGHYLRFCMKRVIEQSKLDKGQKNSKKVNLHFYGQTHECLMFQSVFEKLVSETILIYFVLRLFCILLYFQNKMKSKNIMHKPNNTTSFIMRSSNMHTIKLD